MDLIDKIIGESWVEITERNAEGIITIQNQSGSDWIRIFLGETKPDDCEYKGIVKGRMGIHEHNDSRKMFVRSTGGKNKIALW